MSGQGRVSFASLGVYAGQDAYVRCSTYPDAGPILAVSAGPVSLDLSVAGRNEMPAWAVRFARGLAEQAQLFAAECERLYAAQHGESPPDAGDAGAKDAAA